MISIDCFATDIVREHYPAVALGDRMSFDLDGFCGLHPDLFETPGRGCHIGNNPGVSMLAAIPYALARPLIDPIVARVLARRAASGQTEAPPLATETTNTRRFYAEAYRRGLDVKLGLAALVTQVFCMAPSSALGVVLVFVALLATLKNQRVAMWLAMLYAFGTPVFFRTGFLNHNMMLGHIAFAGLLVVWNPWHGTRLSNHARDFLCGLCGEDRFDAFQKRDRDDTAHASPVERQNAFRAGPEQVAVARCIAVHADSLTTRRPASSRAWRAAWALLCAAAR